MNKNNSNPHQVWPSRYNVMSRMKYESLLHEKLSSMTLAQPETCIHIRHISYENQCFHTAIKGNKHGLLKLLKIIFPSQEFLIRSALHKPLTE